MDIITGRAATFARADFLTIRVYQEHNRSPTGHPGPRRKNRRTTGVPASSDLVAVLRAVDHRERPVPVCPLQGLRLSVSFMVELNRCEIARRRQRSASRRF